MHEGSKEQAAADTKRGRDQKARPSILDDPLFDRNGMRKQQKR
jgi:hypothetical protein